MPPWISIFRTMPVRWSPHRKWWTRCLRPVSNRVRVLIVQPIRLHSLRAGLILRVQTTRPICRTRLPMAGSVHSDRAALAWTGCGFLPPISPQTAGRGAGTAPSAFSSSGRSGLIRQAGCGFSRGPFSVVPHDNGQGIREQQSSRSLRKRSVGGDT